MAVRLKLLHELVYRRSATQLFFFYLVFLVHGLLIPKRRGAHEFKLPIWLILPHANNGCITGVSPNHLRLLHVQRHDASKIH